ncbi:MAG: RluA family pseudouridine synthase [Parasporobacterium sp.]|nr:RluA family pseudouridine synthase [Parasporobacterium sp.]
MSRIVYSVQDDHEGTRIDRYLAEISEDRLSRNYIQNLIKSGCLLVNNRVVKPSYGVKSEDIVCFEIPEDQEPEIVPEDIPLNIIYEDSQLIVVDKPKGMVVHPAAGHYSGTLVNALMFHCRDLSGINGILRPGIVHRIDKDTSGILVCAKSDSAHKCLAEQFKVHSITRKYQAVCVGHFKENEGTVTGSIGRNPDNRKLMAINEKNGRHAVTHYRVLRTLTKHTHIECVLETGRTHQIRVHMASIHHPLLGDVSYGGKLSEYKFRGSNLEGQTLHAKVLGFVHPDTGKYMEFESELPEYFAGLLDIL